MSNKEEILQVIHVILGWLQEDIEEHGFQGKCNLINPYFSIGTI